MSVSQAFLESQPFIIRQIVYLHTKLLIDQKLFVLKHQKAGKAGQNTCQQKVSALFQRLLVQQGQWPDGRINDRISYFHEENVI